MKKNGILIGSVYAENAVPYQIDCYKNFLGFKTSVESNFVSATTPDKKKLISERFSENELKEVFKAHGFDAEIKRGKFYFLFIAKNI